jgi:hypothetical protein
MTNILVLTLAIALPLLLVALVVWFQVAWTRRKRRQMDDRAFALWFYRVYFGLSPKSGVYSSKEDNDRAA